MTSSSNSSSSTDSRVLEQLSSVSAPAQSSSSIDNIGSIFQELERLQLIGKLSNNNYAFTEGAKSIIQRTEKHDNLIYELYEEPLNRLFGQVKNVGQMRLADFRDGIKAYATFQMPGDGKFDKRTLNDLNAIHVYFDSVRDDKVIDGNTYPLPCSPLEEEQKQNQSHSEPLKGRDSNCVSS